MFEGEARVGELLEELGLHTERSACVSFFSPVTKARLALPALAARSAAALAARCLARCVRACPLSDWL